jgi:beta-galactosidase
VTGSAERIIHDVPDALVSGYVPQSGGNIREFAALFKPNLFRVPTENDGLKTYRHLRGDPAAAFYWQNKAMYPWLDLDLAHLRRADEKTEDCTWEGYQAREYTALLAAGEQAADNYRNIKIGSYSCVTVLPGKTNPLIMNITFVLNYDLPELPRVGISAAIPACYNSIKWFGLGPHEAYPDRCAGSFLGFYEDSPASLEVPYIVPQENGNRMGVRYIRLEAAAGGLDSLPGGWPSSITIVPEHPVSMSCSRYSAGNMMEALHTFELKDTTLGEGGYYALNIDCLQRGAGTAACGPDTLEQYRVRPGIYRMKLYVY